MNLDAIPYYQINTGMALLMTISLTALSILMILLRPKTILNQLAMWFAVVCTASMWRYCAALIRPEMFGIRESLIASVFFGVAAMITFAFGAVAWYEHVRDVIRHRRRHD